METLIIIKIKMLYMKLEFDRIIENLCSVSRLSKTPLAGRGAQ